MAFGLTALLVGGVGALAGAGASIYGANKAASATGKAAAQSAAVQKEMFDKQVQLQEPFRNAGLAAQNQLLTLLGIVPQTATAAPDTGSPGAKGKNNAGGVTVPQYNYTVDTSSPDFGLATKAFGMDQFEADPGYSFRLSEGMKAIERSAAARGGLLSGATLKGITRFGQDTASQEYQNAFNRYQIERQARLNPLQSLMGMGQTSANTLTGAAGSLGQGLGQAYAANGAAKASSYINSANALTGAINTGLNNYNMYNMFSSLNNNNSQLYGPGF